MGAERLLIGLLLIVNGFVLAVAFFQDSRSQRRQQRQKVPDNLRPLVASLEKVVGDYKAALDSVRIPVVLSNFIAVAFLALFAA